MKIRLPVDVVKEELCTRCGACIDVCPQKLIQLDRYSYPSMSEKDIADCSECGLCMKACPSSVDFKSLYMKQFGRIPAPQNVTGIVKNIYVGYSTNPDIRHMGSSGGVVTELLLFLLEKGSIDQALVCGMNKKNPLETESYIARTKEEIIDSAQSKYVISPHMRLLSDIIRSGKKTAIVGLPCHIHAFRKMELWRKKKTENVKLVIGLACHRAFEKEAIPKLLELENIEPSMVAKFEYRHGDIWPGSACVILKNGEKKILAHNIKDAFNYLRIFYSPKRCLTCVDFSAEFSDMTMMDPWIRDQTGEYPFAKHYTKILTRNDNAELILKQAVKARRLHLKDMLKTMKINQAEMIEQSQLKYFLNLKKRIIPARIHRYKKVGRAFPEYNVDFPLPSLKDQLSERFDSMTRLPGKWKWSRDLTIRLAFSKVGFRLMELRKYYKKKKIVLKNRRHQQ